MRLEDWDVKPQKDSGELAALIQSVHELTQEVQRLKKKVSYLEGAHTV